LIRPSRSRIRQLHHRLHRRGSRHRRRRCRDHHRRRRRRGLVCPERCLAYAIPAMQRRVDLHHDPMPAARRIGERMPAPGTGPGVFPLDVTRVMSGHDDPGMRCRPDPHPGQRPGDSMPAGVHAARERRRWCGGGDGRCGGCRGSSRVHGRAGGRGRAAASGSSQAYAGNHGGYNYPLGAYGDRISHEIPPRADGGDGPDRGDSAGHSLLRMRGEAGSFRSRPLRYGIRPVTREFPEFRGGRVFIDQPGPRVMPLC
jgi:hypothetical protein